MSSLLEICISMAVPPKMINEGKRTKQNCTCMTGGCLCYTEKWFSCKFSSQWLSHQKWLTKVREQNRISLTWLVAVSYYIEKWWLKLQFLNQKLQMVMNKSKLMQYELAITLMNSFRLTPRNLLNAYSTQFLWDLRIDEYMNDNQIIPILSWHTCEWLISYE